MACISYPWLRDPEFATDRWRADWIRTSDSYLRARKSQ